VSQLYLLGVVVVKAEQDYMDVGLLESADVEVKAEKDLANALDLSESEEEEVLEDVVEDFIRRSQPPSQTDNFEANQEVSARSYHTGVIPHVIPSLSLQYSYHKTIVYISSNSRHLSLRLASRLAPLLPKGKAAPLRSP
jgi:hypothetical protein